jgi:hypothetical protein
MTMWTPSKSYTPGPWTAGASLVSNWSREKQDAGEPIREIALVRENRGNGPPTREEYEANVLLIAAAPTMHQVILDLLTWASVMGEWEAPCWQRARDVLLQVEGST